MLLRLLQESGKLFHFKFGTNRHFLAQDIPRLVFPAAFSTKNTCRIFSRTCSIPNFGTLSFPPKNLGTLREFIRILPASPSFFRQGVDSRLARVRGWGGPGDHCPGAAKAERDTLVVYAVHACMYNYVYNRIIYTYILYVIAVGEGVHI